MRRWQKTAATIWTTLLAAPLLVFLVAYLRLECGELDPCPTGGMMPYAPLALALLLAIAGGQLAFLAMIWRSGPGENGDG